jgi:hypothetical protein
MRVLIAVLAVLLLVTGCTRDVSGTAERDPTPIPAALSKDGSGIKIGLNEAPIQLEIYTEPQCRHCADVQADFGDKLAYYVATGQLAITYRPMVLLDKDNGKHSARVANAMYAAVTPGASDAAVTTSGPAFQRFVMKLFSTWDGGPNVPTVEEMGQMARSAGIPDDQVAGIESVQPAVNTTDKSDLNFEFLYMLDPTDTALPTVYDLNRDKTLDVYDDNWLSKVMES